MSLVCPDCDREHPGSERFCDACGLPLVHALVADDAPKTELEIRARKVRPGYAEGPLVRVAAARHQAEAEMIQGLLLEEGIPSVAPRSGGFDVPDFLASGPRDILVPASAAEAAREILRVPERPPESARPPARVAPWVRALAAALAVLILALVAAGIYAAMFG